MTILSRDKSSSNRQLRFDSKRDLWLVVVLWGVVLGLVYASLNVAGSPTPIAFKVVFIGLCLVSATFIPWILYGTFYVLTGDELLIRCGPFRHRVLVGAIQEITPSRNPLSSPACSLDRLHIKYQGSRNGVLISPVDQRLFLKELASLDPKLSLRGDGIIRGTGT